MTEKSWFTLKAWKTSSCQGVPSLSMFCLLESQPPPAVHSTPPLRDSTSRRARYSRGSHCSELRSCEVDLSMYFPDTERKIQTHTCWVLQHGREDLHPVRLACLRPGCPCS